MKIKALCDLSNSQGNTWTKNMIYNIEKKEETFEITSNNGTLEFPNEVIDDTLENFSKINLPKTNRKYLDELNIKKSERPENFCGDEDNRIPYWKKQRDEYGFDERETWGVSYAFHLWLYERLSMYDEINIVDTSFYNFEFNDRTLTQQDCIDEMLEGLKLKLTRENDFEELSEKNEEKIKNIIPLFNLCHMHLWW